MLRVGVGLRATARTLLARDSRRHHHNVARSVASICRNAQLFTASTALPLVRYTPNAVRCLAVGASHTIDQTVGSVSEAEAEIQLIDDLRRADLAAVGKDIARWGDNRQPLPSRDTLLLVVETLEKHGSIGLLTKCARLNRTGMSTADELAFLRSLLQALCRLSQMKIARQVLAHLENMKAVSYTHLTLPTNREV